MPRTHARKARWAALRGDYAAAGDLYRLEGNLEKALRMYQKGRLHRLAGETALELGDPAVASREFERAGLLLEAAEAALAARDRTRAAQLFLEAGQPHRAARIHEEGGRLSAAAALYEEAGDLLRAAHLFLEARKPDAAARVLQELLRNTPPEGGGRGEIVRLAARLGQIFLASGRPLAAARWFETAGRDEEAAKAWERAHEPAKAVRAWLTAGRPDRAVAVAEVHPPEKLDPALAAEAYRQAGRWAEAAALYLESGNPADAARCLEELGCTAEAAWAHEEAGDLVAAAGSLERAGDLPRAAELYEKAGMWREAARCLEGAGELAVAAERYLEAGDRLRAAELLEKVGDLDRAIEVLQELTRSGDEGAGGDLLLRLGELFERKGLDSLAVEQYEEAIRAEAWPGEARHARWRLARALERLGRFDEAIRVLRDLVARDYGFKEAARLLAALEERAARPGGGAGLGGHPGDRYRPLEELPPDGPGQRWLARDTVMDREVVLRRFPGNLFHDPRDRERFLEEIRRAAHLHHPAIAALHDAGQDGESVWVVEEAVRGESLRDVLAREGALDVPRAVQVVTRLAEALDYSHGLGLLARTISPETVRLAPSGEARLTRFGLLVPAAGPGSGLPRTPPEVLAGEREDPGSDLWSLGMLAFELLAGAPPAELPADGPPPFPAEAAARVPEVLQKVIRGCLEPDRSRRFASARKLLETLHGTSLLPGALLANRYEIRRELGRGGMGTVFEARDLVLDEPVALKVLAGPLDETTEKRFIQEIRLARQINHPNIVRVHTFDRWRDLRFIVMEYIDGIDLRRWVEEHHPIPIGRAIEIVGGIASGLAAAHRLGIVHRDVKPENVLLDREGRPRLVDFGIARKGDVHLTREGLVMGSPAYMAPEQIRGEAADQRADLYALGVLAWFLLVGREPFYSENVAEVLRQQIEDPVPSLRELRPDVPEQVEELLRRVLEKDPARRPQSVFEFLEQLSALRGTVNVVMA